MRWVWKRPVAYGKIEYKKNLIDGNKLLNTAFGRMILMDYIIFSKFYKEQ